MLQHALLARAERREVCTSLRETQRAVGTAAYDIGVVVVLTSSSQ
jgi:hypothetical protein